MDEWVNVEKWDLKMGLEITSWDPFLDTDLMQPGGGERRRRRTPDEVMAEVHVINFLAELRLRVTHSEMGMICELHVKQPDYASQILRFAQENDCSVAEAQYRLPIPQTLGELEPQFVPGVRRRWIEIS